MNGRRTRLTDRRAGVGGGVGASGTQWVPSQDVIRSWLHSMTRLTQGVPWLCGPASRRVCHFVDQARRPIADTEGPTPGRIGSPRPPVLGEPSGDPHRPCVFSIATMAVAGAPEHRLEVVRRRPRGPRSDYAERMTRAGSHAGGGVTGGSGRVQRGTGGAPAVGRRDGSGSAAEGPAVRPGRRWPDGPADNLRLTPYHPLTRTRDADDTSREGWRRPRNAPGPGGSDRSSHDEWASGARCKCAPWTAVGTSHGGTSGLSLGSPARLVSGGIHPGRDACSEASGQHKRTASSSSFIQLRRP